jgi:hypothetical protein
MAVDHHGFASLAELFAVVRAALRQNAHFVEDARAPPGRGCSDFAHSPIFKGPRYTVNLSLRTGVPHPQLRPLNPRKNQLTLVCPLGGHALGKPATAQ